MLLRFVCPADLFTQTPSQLIWEASSHTLQLMREGCSYTYPPQSFATYSFIQLSELEQCRVKKLAHGFNTAAQESNPGSLSRESEALPLSHSALKQWHNIRVHDISWICRQNISEKRSWLRDGRPPLCR